MIQVASFVSQDAKSWSIQYIVVSMLKKKILSCFLKNINYAFTGSLSYL